MTTFDWDALNVVCSSATRRSPILYAKLRHFQLDSNEFTSVDEMCYLGEYNNDLLQASPPPDIMAAALDETARINAFRWVVKAGHWMIKCSTVSLA